MDKPTNAEPPNRALPTFAWWLVLGLVGLDCFSTLGYLPSLAVDGANVLAPLAAVVVSILILFAALPVYLYVVARSPHGRGATGLLEKHLSGWGGKLCILFLLGFVAADFVLTRTLSGADASKHLLANRHALSGIDWLVHRKDIVYDALPELVQGGLTKNVFAWWDAQLATTVLLMLLGFALYYFLLRGFTRWFVYSASVIVALFLLVNGIVLVSGAVYLAHHPEYMNNWIGLVGFASRDKAPLDVIQDVVSATLYALPALVLGLSGFELSMTSTPLVRGWPNDDAAQPRGRIRNARKMLTVTALLMSVLVPASVTIVQFLVPAGQIQEGGAARDRALSYLAHGGQLQLPGRSVTTDDPVGAQKEAPAEVEEGAAAPALPELTPEEKEARMAKYARPTAADLNPLFGAAFGTVYDVSAVLILFLAGACVSISLRDLLPQYLMRYGMEMYWAQRIGVLLHLFNLIVLIVVVAFHAGVSQQQSAYGASVLTLLAAAALAAVIDMGRRRRHFLLRRLAVTPFFIGGLIFLGLAVAVCYALNPTGLLIALLFVVVLFVSAGISRWLRSTELRFQGFTFADEQSGVRWEQIRRLEFQVLVPNRPGLHSLVDKEIEIRAHHRIEADVPIIFIEAELGDPSDFQQYPLLRIDHDNGREVMRVSQCASIAHVLAAIALEFRDVGRPPEVHFGWSLESPLATNLHFLLFGEGNIPWMVRALIRKAEPNPARQPRVVIG